MYATDVKAGIRLAVAVAVPISIASPSINLKPAYITVLVEVTDGNRGLSDLGFRQFLSFTGVMIASLDLICFVLENSQPS